MFFLKKFLSSLIIPPGIFIVLFFLIAILSKESKTIRIIALFSGFSLYLLSLEPCKDFLLHPLESKFKIPENKIADAIVILGGGTYNQYSLKEDTANRLISGYFLFKEIHKPIILSGGSSSASYSDARIMGDILRKMGIRDEFLIEETKSRNTIENSHNVIEICKERGFRRIILITSAYHMPRAYKLFNRGEIELIPYPTDFKIQGEYSISSILPKYTALNGSLKALREYVAILSLFLCH